MVDGTLPIEQRNRPLSYLFLDFNSYFASIEEQERPEIRGKPIAVAPMNVDSTCCISANYEARKYGIKCGTMIREAKQMCPELQVVSSDHSIYEAYHRRIKDVVQTILPIHENPYIDEMSFRLLGVERTPEVARDLAHRIKQVIWDRVGDAICCSIGVAPNQFLAKVATELEKPDGLVVIEASDLPHRLLELKLTDFPGINRRMQARLNAQGIVTTEAMCAASRYEMTRAFGSIVGERWWYLLRGMDMPMATHPRGSFSHSHVLPPDLRTDEGTRTVLIRLLYKAAMRLRSESLWTEGLSFGVVGIRKSWETYVPLPPLQDSTSLAEALEAEWPKRSFDSPIKVWTALTHLKPTQGVTPSLFDERKGNIVEMSEAIDRMNARFGKLKVYPAAIHRARDTAEERIAFGKKELLNEGVRGKEGWRGTFNKLGVNDVPLLESEYRSRLEDDYWWAR